MSLRLRDLWAPAWSVTLTGRRYKMRPLSLGTFADLEGEGLPLSSLSGKAPPQVWARLFILLADLTGEEADEEAILAALLTDPIALKHFQTHLAQSLEYKSEVRAASRRQVKRPPDRHDPKKKNETRAEAETEPEELDATFVLMVARLSGLSLNDISRMSFRGLLALQEWLKENPPQPSGLGMFG